eukprot:2227992-Amphidinium_carterae.1
MKRGRRSSCRRGGGHSLQAPQDRPLRRDSHTPPNQVEAQFLHPAEPSPACNSRRCLTTQEDIRTRLWQFGCVHAYATHLKDGSSLSTQVLFESIRSAFQPGAHAGSIHSACTEALAKTWPQELLEDCVARFKARAHANQCRGSVPVCRGRACGSTCRSGIAPSPEVASVLPKHTP